MAECQRLVLLGDVLELRHGPLSAALAAAQPALSAIGAALAPGCEVLIVPGNHDHHLLNAWLERRAGLDRPPPLGLELEVDWRDGEPLAALAGWLGAGRTRVAYPGAWLREDVYATHGHYGDRHTTVPMLERLGAGAMARIVHEPAGGPRRAEDYEATLAPIYAWIHAIAQTGGPALGRSSHGPSAQAWRFLAGSEGRSSWRQRIAAAAFPAVVAALNCARLGPLRADLSGAELRRAGLAAVGDVLVALRVAAAHVIFGHTHRAGPLPGDDCLEWRAPTGAAMLNTGSWVHEPAFLGARPRASPYRAGFCVTLGAREPPRLRCLLDDASPGVKQTA